MQSSPGNVPRASQPLAVDLQERIALLPAGARGGVADVPMTPVLSLAQAAIVSWLVGWVLLGWAGWISRRTKPDSASTSRSAPWVRGLAIAAVIIGVMSAGTAWWGMRALDASALAVVARPETLRIAPGTDADAMGGVSTGDVVQVVEARESWERVVHADGRQGWLPAVRLVAMQDSLPGSQGPR